MLTPLPGVSGVAVLAARVDAHGRTAGIGVIQFQENSAIGLIPPPCHCEPWAPMPVVCRIKEPPSVLPAVVSVNVNLAVQGRALNRFGAAVAKRPAQHQQRFGRCDGLPGGVAADARRIENIDYVLARKRARKLGVRSAAQDDRAIRTPGVLHGRGQADDHGEHGHRYADHAGNSENNHQRTPQPRRQGPVRFMAVTASVCLIMVTVLPMHQRD